METATGNLRTWFENLERYQQREVLQFLYGKTLVVEGGYMGPDPDLVSQGLFVGPAPQQSQRACPYCRRPL